MGKKQVHFGEAKKLKEYRLDLLPTIGLIAIRARELIRQGCEARRQHTTREKLSKEG